MNNSVRSTSLTKLFIVYNSINECYNINDDENIVYVYDCGYLFRILLAISICITWLVPSRIWFTLMSLKNCSIG